MNPEEVAKAILNAEENAPQFGDVLPPGEAVTIRVAGVQGEPGIQGEQGPGGKDGPPGERGPKGDTGDKGELGTTGADGKAGKDGATGKTGPKGPKGDSGPKGDKGNTGPQGPAGQDAPVPMQQWRPGGGGGGGGFDIATHDAHDHTGVPGVGAGGSDDQTAAEVPFTPVGTIAATDTQTAVAEVATDAATALSTHAADTTSIHGIADTAALVVDGDAAGGDLGGTYPNPTVTDDSHSHTAATLPAGGVTIDEYGTTAAGASWEAFTASRTIHKKITVTNAGRLLSVAAYVKGDGSGVRSWGVALYDDNSNAPGKLIAAHVPKDTSLFLSTTGRWVEMPLAGTVTATAYWVALLMQADTNISIGYDTGGSDPRSSNSGQWFSDGLSMTDTTRNFSMHVAVLRA